MQRNQPDHCVRTCGSYGTCLADHVSHSRGRDTTAQALSWTYFHLIDRPELVEPLRKEVDEFERVDYDNFKDCTQTLAAFQEGLRLHPSVPKVSPSPSPSRRPSEVLTSRRRTSRPRSQTTKSLTADRSFARARRSSGTTGRWAGTTRSGPTRASTRLRVGSMARTSSRRRRSGRRTSQLSFGHRSASSSLTWFTRSFNGGQRLCLGQNLALYEATMGPFLFCVFSRTN